MYLFYFYKYVENERDSVCKHYLVVEGFYAVSVLLSVTIFLTSWANARRSAIIQHSVNKGSARVRYPCVFVQQNEL